MKQNQKRKSLPNAVMARVVEHFGSQTKLAEDLGTSQQFISQMVNGKCDVPLLYALKIEKLTHGKFTLNMLLSEKRKCYLKKN